MAAINIKTAIRVNPQCYAYTLPEVPSKNGWTKIGFTERDVNVRIAEQLHTAGLKPNICWHLLATYRTEPFGNFTDKDFHLYLKKLGFERERSTEWFKIDPNIAKSNYNDFTENHGVVNDATDTACPYTLRDEQNDAVEMTLKYFHSHKDGEFLWNAKPRFGKTLAAYDLCKRMKAKNILIVTNRPAIANSWYSDYETFLGTESGLYFVSSVDGIKDKKYVYSRSEYVDKVSKEDSDDKGCIQFVSLQDLKGSIYFGGQYDKLMELSDTKDEKGNYKGILWDMLIIDEAHEGVDTYKTDIAFDHIRRCHTLHLSGTPFKALANDKFSQDAIYNWTYADEQAKKRDWNQKDELENPYENLPCLNLYTYQMSDIIKDKLTKGIELDNNMEEYAFDLNEFFATNESGKFLHDVEVDKFLDALTKQEKFPFSTDDSRDELKHTFWLLNRVASVKALAKKLELHPVFSKYKVVVAAGNGKQDDDDENRKSFDRVTEAIKNHDKTITISVGQLTTGVTIKEWSAVLMLSNMSSPSLYMQAAFRAQNPCLFKGSNGEFYRKKNAYVFDFDPARTLTIFEKFANDLIPKNAGNNTDIEKRKDNIKALLNFFPVYGEDDCGEMTLLDAESVLSIPRHIYAREVVERGFMSNFLFANISGIFAAPREIIDVINNMQAIEEPKALNRVNIDENTVDELCINNGIVELSTEQVIGTAKDLFGEKIHSTVSIELTNMADEIVKNHESNPQTKKNELDELQKKFSKPLTDIMMETVKQKYGNDLKKSTQNQLERDIHNKTSVIVKHKYGEYTINANKLEKEKEEKIAEAQNRGASMIDISKLDKEYNNRKIEIYNQLVHDIKDKLDSEDTVKSMTYDIVETVETEKLNKEKESIESSVRDHLRGFSRTIPAFLMAYGDENTTLENFDKLVPEDVFFEVTKSTQSDEGVTLAQFRMLRDGGFYYKKDEHGNEIRDEKHKKYFEGHLFDEVVFNDAVTEFMKKRAELADYFSESNNGDIFDYIPAQRTNQIFTPKPVVKDMVDRLEKENPNCFDDPEATFADLYMKSGMYITEIVKRIFQSNKMKELFPDEAVRLNHIFANQVYGCAPTEIIYQICRRYILGFSDRIKIEKDNIKLCDTLEYAKNGKLEDKMRELFGFES